MFAVFVSCVHAHRKRISQNLLLNVAYAHTDIDDLGAISTIALHVRMFDLDVLDEVEWSLFLGCYIIFFLLEVEKLVTFCDSLAILPHWQ
jgi:hypothetical protein